MAQKIKEANFWNWLSKAREYYGPALDIQRIENITGSGTPDVEGHLTDEGSFWIELKTTFRPARFNTPLQHGLKPAQINWIHRRHKVGGNAYILIQVGTGSSAKIYLVSGRHALEFQKPMTEGILDALAQENADCTHPHEIIQRAASWR